MKSVVHPTVTRKQKNIFHNGFLVVIIQGLHDDNEHGKYICYSKFFEQRTYCKKYLGGYFLRKKDPRGYFCTVIIKVKKHSFEIIAVEKFACNVIVCIFHI